MKHQWLNDYQHSEDVWLKAIVCFNLSSVRACVIMMPQVIECANVGRDANHKRRFTFYLYLESRLDARTLKMYSIKDRSSRSLSILTLRRVIAIKRRPCVGPRASRVSLTRVLFSCYTLELSTAGLFWMQMTTSIGINQISKCNRICSMA